jgi:BlaI family penicillinase repressor
MEDTLHISDAEWRVMHEVWLDEPITSNELVDRLTTSTNWTPTTIKTLLHRLVKKGALAYYRKGKRYYYRSMESRSECMRNASDSFLDTVFDGRRVHMLSYLVQTTQLESSEVDYLRNLLREIDGDNKAA